MARRRRSTFTRDAVQQLRRADIEFPRESSQRFDGMGEAGRARQQRDVEDQRQGPASSPRTAAAHAVIEALGRIVGA
jgi:hypothetical protein